ncbi:MAG: SDR family NAD(P)-dependent oxidoreductase [Trebonia sp.]
MPLPGLRGECEVLAEAGADVACADIDEEPARATANNAGIADPQALLLHEYPTANWRAVLDVDLDGVFFCAREALKVMAAQQSGKIINIASIWVWPAHPAFSRRWPTTPPRAP